MISFKGILKYSIYLFIAGWMFLLGIMVGRGNSPVTFDTQQFQQRLENIAADFGEKKVPEKKIELKFYDVLEQPVAATDNRPPKKDQEIIPKKEPPVTMVQAAVKTSLKRQTYNVRPGEKLTIKSEVPSVKQVKKQLGSSQEGNLPEKKALAKPDTGAKKAGTAAKAPLKTAPGKYTLQIAAYKRFKDAVTQMAALEKKGISTYRVRGEKDGVTWYRVRTGSFATYEAAKKFKHKLEKAKIKSMILKKETYENIKG